MCESERSNQSAAARRDPEEWETGEEPMTPAQRGYLKSLCEKASVEFEPELRKAQASRRIDELLRQLRRKSGTAAGSPRS